MLDGHWMDLPLQQGCCAEILPLLNLQGTPSSGGSLFYVLRASSHSGGHISIKRSQTLLKSEAHHHHGSHSAWRARISHIARLRRLAIAAQIKAPSSRIPPTAGIHRKSRLASGIGETGCGILPR